MRRTAHGFTLGELVTALAVAGVLLAIGVPAFAGLQQRARTDTIVHRLSGSLAAARLAAVKLGRPVSLCPSRDGRRCTQDTAWDGGWIMFVDAAREEQPTSDDMVLRHTEAIGEGLELRSTRGRTQVRFTPSGWAYGSNLSIRLCSSGQARLLAKVVVNNAGRPRSERPDEATACPYPVQ